MPNGNWADPGFAPAKLNLCLHVVGQRADGYHELESLVAFASVGDDLAIEESVEDQLEVLGRFAAGVPTDGANIVLKALLRLRERGADIPPLRLRLRKNLPHSAGIGGGSADAGAMLRLLLRRDASLGDLAREVALTLGADVPMCFDARPAFATGVGELCAPLATLPDLFLVLVNPGTPMATPPVFARLAHKRNAPMPVLPAGGFRSLDDLLGFLRHTRNDLATPAESIAPAVREAVAAVRATGAAFARMSGSGATVFGLYPGREAAAAAAETLSKHHPSWWVEAATSPAVRQRQGIPA